MEKVFIKRPELTFPDEVAGFVEENYKAAKSILEYGSGGSTVLASELPGKTIYSVESDKAWALNLQIYIEQSSLTLSFPEIFHVDIGPTKAWGHPKSDTHWRQYFKYPAEVWARQVPLDPDLILIDGRFRLACFITSCLMTTQPVRILFDDYTDRKIYHSAEMVAKPSVFVGRMAVFDIVPSSVRRDHLSLFLNSMCTVA